MPLLVVLLTPVIEGSDVPPRAMQATIVGLGVIVVGFGRYVFAVAGRGRGHSACGGGVYRRFFAHRAARVHRSASAHGDCSGAWRRLIVAVGASLAIERGQPVQWNRNAAVAVIALAAVGGAPAYAAYFWLLQQLAAYKVTTVQWIEPLVGFIETRCLLRIGLSFAMIAGSWLP